MTFATGALLGASGLIHMFWGGSNSAPVAEAPGSVQPIPPMVPGGPNKGPNGNFPHAMIDYSKPIAPPPSGDGVPGSGIVDINASDFFTKYGHPGPYHDQANRDEFISFYDRRTRIPLYVVEHVTKDSLNFGRDADGKPPADRKNSAFKEDTAITEEFRSRLRDYFRSGYDRGHLAPAADAKFSQRAMDQTFFLSNMAPQVGDGFNRDYWAHLEDFCRRLANDYKSVRIVSGPMFLPKRDPVTGKTFMSYEVIGEPPSVAVPTHFYKIVVGEDLLNGKGRKEDVAIAAFVLPNAPINNATPLKSFLAPVSAIERATGLEFFTKVNSRNKKDLCSQVACEIRVREFNNAVKSLPAPRK